MPGHLRTLLALCCCCVVVAAVAAGPAQAAPTTMEKRLVARINDARSAHGLRQLRIRDGAERRRALLVAVPPAT